MLEILLTVLIPFAVMVGLFLMLRRFVLWYWRVNEAIELLSSIDASLKCLPAVRRQLYAEDRASGSAA